MKLTMTRRQMTVAFFTLVILGTLSLSFLRNATRRGIGGEGECLGIVRYPRPPRNDTDPVQLTILRWSRTPVPVDEVYDRGQGRCRWTNDRCALPRAHAVVVHYDQIRGSDLPWPHYR